MRRNLLIALLSIVACVVIATSSFAEEFEWYGVKDGVSGGINLRKEASLDAGIHTCMILNFFYVKPLFKVVAKEGEWFKCKSNRDGIPRQPRQLLRA